MRLSNVLYSKWRKTDRSRCGNRQWRRSLRKNSSRPQGARLWAALKDVNVNTCCCDNESFDAYFQHRGVSTLRSQNGPRLNPTSMRNSAPLLSPTSGWLLSGYFATSYVASLYMLRAGRLVFTAQQTEVGPAASRARAENERWRNDPSTIRARIIGVSISTVVSCGVVYAVVTNTGSWQASLVPPLVVSSDLLQWGDTDSVQQTLRLLGLSLPTSVPLGAWFLAPLMYTGSIYVQLLDKELPLQRNWSFKESIRPIFTTWLGFRNIIAVCGPQNIDCTKSR